jgi:hypothetical protein
MTKKKQSKKRRKLIEAAGTVHGDPEILRELFRACGVNIVFIDCDETKEKV